MIKLYAWGYQGTCVEAPIEKVIRERSQEWRAIGLKNGTLFVQPDHKFYDAYIQQWATAKDLDEGSLLLHSCTNTHVVFDNREVEFDAMAYDLTIADYHNFFVSEHEIVVHNVIPLIVFGANGAAFAGWGAIETGLASTALEIGATWLVNGIMRNVFGASGGVDYGYDECVMDEVLNDIRNQHETMTRKDARKVAKEKGWTEIPDPGFDTRGQPAFKSGRKIITPDADGIEVER